MGKDVIIACDFAEKTEVRGLPGIWHPSPKARTISL